MTEGSEGYTPGLTENAKRVAMTEACRDALMGWAARTDALGDSGIFRREMRQFVSSIEILPNPEPAPAEAVADDFGARMAGEAQAALNRMDHYGVWNSDDYHFEHEGKDVATIRAALARLAELEKRQPSEEQVRDDEDKSYRYAIRTAEQIRKAHEAVEAVRSDFVNVPDWALRQGAFVRSRICDAIAAALPTPANAEEKR